VWSRTTKQADCSSADQGGGKRRVGTIYRGGLLLDPNFSTRGKPIVIVGDPEHDRLGRAIFSAIRKCTHLLTPLTPMIGVIGQQTRHRRCFAIRHWKEREAGNPCCPN